MDNRWAALGGMVLVALLATAAWRIAASGGEDQAAGGTAGTPAQPAPSPLPAPGSGAPDAGGGAADAGSRAPVASGDPTGTAGGEPSATGSAPSRPSPGTTASEVAAPTPSPAAPPGEAGEPLVGVSRRDDRAGDLADSAGAPPPEAQPAADLTAVALSGDGDRLQVEFALAGDVPSSAGSLVWSLDLWLEDDLAYTVTVQKVGARLVAGVLDWQSGEQAAPPAPALAQGRGVSVSVPREMLTRVDGPFRWQAVGQADGGYEDFVPADGVLDWFPGPDG